MKHASEAIKNALMREMMASCVNNTLTFRYLLMDSGFSSVESFDFIVNKKKQCIAALKDNRWVAFSEEDKQQGRFVRIESLHYRIN